MTKSSSEVAEAKVGRDDAATRIGKLYRKGRESLVLAGEMLAAQKALMAHGEWLKWLKANTDKLGFSGRQTASQLMRLANDPLTDHLDIWGNAGRPPGGGGSVEWYTPSLYVEMARKVLGEIDLDPASSEHAQKTIKAKTFFTREGDGLAQTWSGRIWLNPPYSMPGITEFANKMILSLSDIEAAVMLTNSATDTEWFQTLASVAAGICFTNGRLRFETEEGPQNMPMQGQAFFYFGGNRKMFIEVFSPVGVIMVRP
jgi:hypothetical protein